jgi:prophage regulatory protein
MELTGYSKPTLLRLSRTGAFPAPIKLGPRAIGWYIDEVESYLASRPRACGPGKPQEAADPDRQGA